MPDPTNPFPPGTPEHERYEQLMAAQSGGSTSTSNRPTAENVPPGGNWTGNPTTPGSVYTVPLTGGGHMIYTVQKDGSLSQQASGARIGQASTSSGGAGGTTNYRTANVSRDDLIARGGVPFGSNTMYVRNGSAVDKYSLDTDGSWRPFGTVTNRTELGYYAQAVANQGSQPRPTGQPPAGAPPVGQQQQPEAPLIIDPLRPSQAPTFGSQAFQSAVQPGAQMSQTGTRTYGLGNALDRISVANPGQGFSGYINKQEGQRAPANIGTGPAVSANLIQFPGGIGRGYTEPSNPFGSVSYTVPDTYNRETGFNDRGFFEPVSLAYNVTAPNIDPLAGPVTQGGMGQMLLAGPQTVHGMNGTPGFNPNAVAASNIGLAYGRDFSGLDPAGRAVATAALLDRQMQEQEREQAELGGGAGGGIGWMNFARGGRIVTDPLGYARGGELITNGPHALVEMGTGRVKAIMGEDNADRDMRPDRELLRFNPSGMTITPLEPPRVFAEGGNIIEGPQPPPPTTTPPPTTQPAPFTPTEGNQPPPEGGSPGGDIPPAPPPDAAPPDAGTPPATPPPLQFPVWQGVIPPQVGPPVTPLDPLGPDLSAIRAPWQQAQQQLMEQAYRRRTIDDPRRRAAGLGSSVGIATEGDVPQEQLPPGMFYDPSGQVSRMINEIEGAASTLTALGPGEAADDLTAIHNRATYVGQALDDMEKIRRLEDARVAVAAGGQVPNLQVGNLMAQFLQSQINELSSQLVGPSSPLYNSPANQALQQQIAQMQAQMNQLNALNSGQLQQADTAGQLQVLNAQIAWLQSRLPPGMSEADLTTELAGLRNRISTQDRRVQATQAVLNLAKVGVPAIGAPRQTLDPLGSGV